MSVEGRSAWFVAVCVVVLGSIGLSVTGLTVLRGELPWGEAAEAPPAATALVNHDLDPAPSFIRATTPIPTRTATPMLTPTPGEDVEPPVIEYVVVRGDVLERIARQFGVTDIALAERNNLAPPYRLEVGQVLLVPTPE